MPKGVSGILLLLLAMFLLMLAFSGRFHAIITAAFPSLAGGSSGGTTPTDTGSGAPGIQGLQLPQMPPPNGPTSPTGGDVNTKQIYQTGGYQIAPTQGGGYEYVTG